MHRLEISSATKGEERRRFEVVTGPQRRVPRSDEEKARIVAETLDPEVCIADVARRHGVHPQQLYTWRRQAKRGELALSVNDGPMFAAVIADAPPTCAAAVGDDACSRCERYRH